MPSVKGGETGDGFFVASKDKLEIWQWGPEVLNRGQLVTLPFARLLFVLPEKRYLALTFTSDGQFEQVTLGLLATSKVTHVWDRPNGGDFIFAGDGLGVSSNGKFGAAIAEKGDLPFQIGSIELSTFKLKWIGNLSGHGNATIRQIAVSDDGRYVAVGGWDNGIALADSMEGKILWTGRPTSEVSTGYVAFSRDGQWLYSAGSEGCLYTLEVRTGKIVSRWWASQAGKSVYGHRVSCLATSPDGTWVAVGTGPEGEVYLWNTTSPNPQPRVFLHGGRTVTVLSFSPDSKYLASAADSRIRVWKVQP
jgi:WD40 repeat protein